MRQLIWIAALVCTFVLNAAPQAGAVEGASPDDTAKFLAAIAPSAGSALAPLTTDASWQSYARATDAQWKALENSQLSKVRAFSRKNLTAPRQTLFYMFSGPDYLYANAFFPDASTYILSGLEPVGRLPDISKLKPGSLPGVLKHLKASMNQVLSHSFFITSEMDSKLRHGQLSGTLPILYVFLARSGKTIHEVTYVDLDAEGAVTPVAETNPATTPRAVKIVFSTPGRGQQTLYYFSTNLSNKGVAQSGFLKFCQQHGPADSLVKSASYLLHNAPVFSTVRDFLLENSSLILQDDTGVPIAYFKDETWRLQPFGRYTRPIRVFSGQYQSKLATLFQKGNPPPLDFGIGYKWRLNQSNLMLATKRDLKAELKD